MRVLVSEIHPMNLLLFWLLSFVVKVEAYEIHRMCPKLLCQRIESMDLRRCLSLNDGQRFRSRVMQVWEGLHEKCPRKHWTCFSRGRSLDFTTKAKQDLAGDLDRLLLLQEVGKWHRAKAKVFIIDSPQFRYLRRLDPSADSLRLAGFPFVSRANVYLDLIFSYAYSLGQMLLLLKAMLRGWLIRDPRHPRHTQRVPFIWDGVSLPDLAVDSRRRFYPWIVDGKRIVKEDILFILPQFTNPKSSPHLYSAGYNAATIQELYRRVPFRVMYRNIRDLLVLIARYLIPMPRSLASIRMAGYQRMTIRLTSAVGHLEPACYITSVSRIGDEDPATVYLNAIHVKTVMYFFSASQSQFVSDNHTCDFRKVMYSNILASTAVVWNENNKKIVEGHPQDKTQVEVIGPLMAGDETVLQLPKEVLRGGLGVPPAFKAVGLRYISIFDVAPQSDGNKSSNSVPLYPDPYTEDYSLAFLRDMVRLLEDFDNVALVFKPHRSLTGVKFSYASEFHDLTEQLKDSGRGFIIDHDINPWVPIALADLCIGMPFTSPPLAAIHYRIPGMFHDPTGVALHHRHQSLSHSITHEYEQLRSKVRSLAFESPRHDGDEELLWSESREFTGPYPGTNSADRFRELLSNTAKKTS